MKENIKITLLAIIAITVVISTFFMKGNNSRPRRSANNQTITTPIPDAVKQKQSEVPPQPVGPITAILFSKMDHDFGSVNQDSENQYNFSFKNTGIEPLLISNAKGSCGCTIPKYPTGPIAPGESALIEVVYKPGKQRGKQQKTVTITANTNPPQTQLKIMADVQFDQ